MGCCSCQQGFVACLGHSSTDRLEKIQKYAHDNESMMSSLAALCGDNEPGFLACLCRGSIGCQTRFEDIQGWTSFEAAIVK